MSTFLGIVRFEVAYYLRRISTGVYFALFLVLSYVVMQGFAGTWESFDLGSSQLRANSPLRVATLTGLMTLLTIPVTSAIVGNAVHRDFESRIHPLFFTTPVSPRAYLVGRYVGAVLVNLLILLSVPLGLLLGTLGPFVQAGRIGPAGAGTFLLPFLVLTIPSVALTGAIFLSLAALTRRMLPNYAGALLLLAAYSVSQRFRTSLDPTVGALVDPFGLTALGQRTRYWTVAEQNASALPLGWDLLAGRVLWLGIGAAILAWAIARFRFAHGAEEGRAAALDAPPPEASRPLEIPDVALSFARGTRLRQLAATTRRDLRSIVGNVYFPVIVAGCLSLLLVGAAHVGEHYGTRTYPVTYEILDLLLGSFGLLVMIVIAFYTGELVWGERDRGEAPLTDSLPLPGWLPFLSKLLAISAVLALLMATAMVVGMVIQASYGWFRFQPLVYLRGLFLHQLTTFLLVAVVALLIHVVVNQKYVGHVLVVGYYMVSIFLPSMGVEHNLLNYGSGPEPQYSEMNGWGHGGWPWLWFRLYWALVAVLLAMASTLLWVRGRETDPRGRVRIAARRLTRPFLAGAAGVLALVLATGGWVFYNTNVRNEFTTSEEGTQGLIDYERSYRRYHGIPQPRIAAVSLDVDLWPAKRDMRVRGRYRLVNRTRVAIDSVHVDVPSSFDLRTLELSRPSRRVLRDDDGGYHILALRQPLQPGDTVTLRFELAHVTRGFTNALAYGPVVNNGTFIASDLMPKIGYNPNGELADDDARERKGLPPRPRLPAVGDSAGRQRNELSYDADWIDFETTVSTDADQVAVAPGYLQGTWTRGGRRYFRYRMDAPILNFYAFLSGRYQVRRDRWKGVAIEVYHHPGHAFNVDRMVGAVKKSLDYFTEAFGPYQHRQVRILEFPRYGAFAQSFANTIPYSESMGFIADVRPGDIDYPFFVTAHEVAHQWWGHQAVGAQVQGAAMLSETLAEYSALMVMEKEYGREKMERWLGYELDGYLRGRATERVGERPISRVEGQQYVHYNKGALAMYALRDRIGEERLNGALAAYLREWRFRGPPYATSADLLEHLRAATPDSLRSVVDDLFERVVLYENRTRGATARRVAGGRWEVELTVEARKLHADSLGTETEVPMREAVDVGVYGADEGSGTLLYLRKHPLVSGRQRIRVTVDREPRRAGVDPQRKLIDRQGEDNVVEVRRSGG